MAEFIKNKMAGNGIAALFSKIVHILVVRNNQRCAMKKIRGMAAVFCLCILTAFVLGGCETVNREGARGSDWDYTVVPTADCPEALKTEIENKKMNAFQMTYDDGEYTYLAVGYGEQEKGGFSIQVLGLYGKGEGLCLETSLNGPGEDEVVSNKPSCPYIVIKTEKTEKEVLFTT